MDKADAEALLAIAVSMDKKFGEMFEYLRQMTESSTKDKFKRSVEDLMGHVTIKMTFPIVELYPDLDPDADAKDARES